jgi:hypothetical protein
VFKFGGRTVVRGFIEVDGPTSKPNLNPMRAMRAE